jgi:hypothetical protein
MVARGLLGPWAGLLAALLMMARGDRLVPHLVDVGLAGALGQILLRLGFLFPSHCFPCPSCTGVAAFLTHENAILTCARARSVTMP